jgi:hypothetical protein
MSRPSTSSYQHHPSRIMPQVDGQVSMSPSLLERFKAAFFNTTGNVRDTADYLEHYVEEPGEEEEVTSKPRPIPKQVTWGENMTRTMSKFGKSCSKVTQEINYLKGL